MNLPINYDSLTPAERRMVRERYVEIQNGLCAHCHRPLSLEASESVMSLKINARLFPKNFFNWPIHLHHCHNTGMTIGAVHCNCNAVLWQYYGE